jgi:hypothetical protein
MDQQALGVGGIIGDDEVSFFQNDKRPAGDIGWFTYRGTNNVECFSLGHRHRGSVGGYSLLGLGLKRRGGADALDLGNEALALLEVARILQSLAQVTHFATTSLPSLEISFRLPAHVWSYPPDLKPPGGSACPRT